jgi:hypothetical protein
MTPWRSCCPGSAFAVSAADGATRLRELLSAHLDAICCTARRLGVPAGDLEEVVQDASVVILLH